MALLLFVLVLLATESDAVEEEQLLCAFDPCCVLLIDEVAVEEAGN
jgi:hypothetical protein